MATRRAFPLIAALLAGLIPCAVGAAGAGADGDPASDVLLGQSVFYPYQPPVSATVQRALNSETAAAKRAGYPIRVALIASPLDLGVIPELFNKPQQYAGFLYREISFIGKGPLLVVMPNGYGTADVSGPPLAAARALRPPAGRTSTHLALAAITAVSKLAAAAGHPIKGVPGVGSASGDAGGSGSSTTPILIGLVAAAVLVAGGVLVVRRRRPARPTARSRARS